MTINDAMAREKGRRRKQIPLCAPNFEDATLSVHTLPKQRCNGYNGLTPLETHYLSAGTH